MYSKLVVDDLIQLICELMNSTLQSAYKYIKVTFNCINDQ